MSLTTEELTELAVKAAVAAIQVAMGGAAASPVVAEEPAAVEELADIRKMQEDDAARAARVQALVSELLPLIMQARHLEVFRWAAGGQEGRALTEVMRAHVARITPDYREAKGGGGASSRNVEALSERLPVHK